MAAAARRWAARESGLHILVVEDDAGDACLIRRALEDDPRVARLDFADDGAEALAILDQGAAAPDLAIIDLKMPRMDGFRLLRELARRRTHGFPVLVLTSSTAASDAARSLLNGANRVVAKPDTLEELERELSSAIAAV
jgi:two-component system response regulator